MVKFMCLENVKGDDDCLFCEGPRMTSAPHDAPLGFRRLGWRVLFTSTGNYEDITMGRLKKAARWARCRICKTATLGCESGAASDRTLAWHLRCKVMGGWYRITTRRVGRREIYEDERPREHFVELPGERPCNRPTRVRAMGSVAFVEKLRRKMDAARGARVNALARRRDFVLHVGRKHGETCDSCKDESGYGRQGGHTHAGPSAEGRAHEDKAPGYLTGATRTAGGYMNGCFPNTTPLLLASPR